MSLVQLQPYGLIMDALGPGPTKSSYDASRRVEVDQLQITPRGIEATLPTGQHALDIHHLDHPDKAYDDDLICVGFTAHYDAMRGEFGAHMVDGIAGENIIVDYSDEVWPEDLGKTWAIENQDNGEVGNFSSVSFAAPCVEFSRFLSPAPSRGRAGRTARGSPEVPGQGPERLSVCAGSGPRDDRRTAGRQSVSGRRRRR